MNLLTPIHASKNLIEGMLFSARHFFLFLFAVLTLFFSWQASQIRPDASFIKMIPSEHPYISNFLQYRDDLSGLGNSVRIAVAARQGDIFDADFQQTLKQITDEVFFIPGVDRSALMSIWTPNVRWTEVTEEGFVGGPVIGPDFDGSEQSLAILKTNILKSNQVGRLVANDFRSAIIQVPLFDVNPETGEKLDYQAFSEKLEALVRDKYESDTISIHMTGFAKIVGDLIAGAVQVALFFALAIAITWFLLYLYSRSLAGSFIPLVCSVIAVIWQLGILNLLGYGLDPYSMLVPFLVFAIAVSHGVQVVNSLINETAAGKDKLNAAKCAFALIYIPGLTALLSDGIGFITLMIIEIQVIQDLAVAAAIGVAVIVVTNLLLLPLLLSYTGISAKAVEKARESARQPMKIWSILTVFTQAKGAYSMIAVALVCAGLGLLLSQNLQIGDLDSGAPELRKDSRYNLDNSYMTSNYSTSSDIFVVMAKTGVEQCGRFKTLAYVDRFQRYLENVAGVQSSIALPDIAERATAGMNEGSLRWRSVSRNQFVVNASLGFAPPGLMSSDCSLLPVIIFLDDHKAKTLSGLTTAISEFVANEPSDQVELLMAAGNSGFEAATNEVIATAQYEMLMWVYAVVSFLCLLTFRSIKAVACIILPLALTSLLCQALMAQLGIGVKVATLPVIALGVGIGVDYGIYIYTRLNHYLNQSLALTEAYLKTLQTTGKPVAFTGLTLAIGVVLWVFSPIKFQADMGVLLTFMFLLNMLGALLLLPALAYVFKVRPVSFG